MPHVRVGAIKRRSIAGAGRAARELLVAAARGRLVIAALELQPGHERSLRLARFRVRCAELLLRLAERA